jgi:murein L,D-transpeptidase YafK
MSKANISKCILALFALLAGYAASADPKADLVVVNKSESRLYLQSRGKAFASFKVAFGAQPHGHKQTRGDERTPEGRYSLDWKNANSGYYKSIHVSYPNATDRARAQHNVADAGGDIMIHGQRNGWGWFAPITQLFNWTDGCIALSNGDMDVVWRAVDVDTPITIRP